MQKTTELSSPRRVGAIGDEPLRGEVQDLARRLLPASVLAPTTKATTGPARDERAAGTSLEHTTIQTGRYPRSRGPSRLQRAPRARRAA
jgi:hypothetical protein